MASSLSIGQRLLVALAAASRFGSGVVMSTSFAVLVDRTGGSPLAVSLLFTAYFSGVIVFAPVWGAIADVTGRRRAVLVVTGVFSTATVLPLFVFDGPAALIGSRGLYAVFAAGFPPVMLAIVSDAGGATGRGRALGFFNSARATGFTGAQLVAGVLLGLVAPAGIYWVIVASSLVATAAVALIDDHPSAAGSEASGRARPAEPPVTLSAVLREVRSRLLPARADRQHLHENGLQWLYVALALRNMTVLGVLSLLPVYLTSDVGFPEALMGVVLAFNPASQAIFMVLFGRIADAHGRRPLVIVGIAGAGVFAILAGLAVVPDAFPARLVLAGAGSVVIGASYSAMTTGALAFIGDVAPDGRESELMGLRSTAKGVGAVVGAPAFGLLATVAGYSTTFLVGSSLAFLAAVLAWRQLVEPAASPASPTPADD